MTIEMMTKAEEMRRSTIKDAAFEAGEDIARYALATLRRKLVEGGLDSYHALTFKDMEERDQYLGMAKARLNVALAQGLEEIV
jgi:hypothetical protein